MLGTRSPCMIAVLIVCVVAWSTDGFAQELPEGRSVLAHVREASPETFTITVEVDQPVHVFLPGQGRSTRVMRFTVGKDVTAIVWKASQLPVPKYFPPDTPGYQQIDYDADGNLTVPMWSLGATLRGQGVNEEYSEVTGFRVAPDGAAKPLNSSALLFRHRALGWNTESLGLLRRILWALGRPWADGVGDVMSRELNADGRQRLRTTGWWSPGHGSGAVCELLIEPGNGYLVRQASFGAEGEAPRAECRSEGTRRFGDVVLAERGEFSLHIETFTVRLISFKPELDTDLIAEARKVISRAQTRMVQVSDFRDDPTKRKVRLISPGDLDKDE